MSKYSQEIINRFWSNVDKISSPNGCWLWTSGTYETGYGMFTYRDRQRKKHIVRAHRFAYELKFGFIPPKMLILHRPPCTDRRCVRHIYAGTHKQNVADCIEMGNFINIGETHWTHRFPERVPKGEKHWKAKLTEQQVLSILTEYSGKHGEIVKVAKKYKVNPMTIRRIIHGRSFKKVFKIFQGLRP